MRKSEIILIETNKIHYDYMKSKNYDLFCDDYIFLINKLAPFWNSIKEFKPAQNQYCLCLEDLSSLGKGIFVDFLFFKNDGFFANINDDDSYGFITHWISVDELDS